MAVLDIFNCLLSPSQIIFVYLSFRVSSFSRDDSVVLRTKPLVVHRGDEDVVNTLLAVHWVASFIQFPEIFVILINCLLYVVQQLLFEYLHLLIVPSYVAVLTKDEECLYVKSDEQQVVQTETVKIKLYHRLGVKIAENIPSVFQLENDQLWHCYH